MAKASQPRAGSRASVDRRGSPPAGQRSAEALLGLVSDIVCCFDAAGRHTYVSPNGGALGLGPRARLAGRSHRELGLAEPLPSIWEALLQRVLESGAPTACDIAAPDEAGQTWFSWRLCRRDTGHGPEVVAVARDISQQRRHERRLRELTQNLERLVDQRTAQLIEAHGRLRAEAGERERLEVLARDRQHEIERIARANLLSGMASGLAHELNQPLSGALFCLSGCIRAFQSGGLSDADGIEALSAALGQVRRAGEIVRHVLDMTRRHVPAVRPMRVETVLEEAAGLLRLEAHGSGIRVETRLEGVLPDAHADSIQVEQVIINLARNAMDSLTAAGAGGVVTLAARATGTAVEVSVRDDGPGFSPEALEHLFEAFYTTKHDGVGLGLSICRAIIEEYGGRIIAENDRRIGACVRFTLPTQPRRP